MKTLKRYKKILLLLILVGGFIAWQKFSNNPKIQTVAVKNVTPEKRVVVKTVSASGKVKSVKEADLSFPSSQKITNIHVNENESVEAGKLLANIEGSNLYQTAQSYKDARDIAIRQKELFEKNRDANEKSLGGEDQYNIKLREYNEEISRASALYSAQWSLLRNTALHAPFAGTVIDVTKNSGEIASAGEVIFKIADLNDLYFELDIDQEDFGQLRNGMEATLELDAYPNTEFKAVITELPLFVNTDVNSSFTAKAIFKDSLAQKPFLGMTGDIKIHTESTQQEVDSLYYDEIYSDDEYDAYVWVLDKDVLSKQPIEIGLEGDIYTELKQQVDKQIVVPVSSDAEIRDGYKAKVVK